MSAPNVIEIFLISVETCHYFLEASNEKSGDSSSGDHEYICTSRVADIFSLDTHHQAHFTCAVVSFRSPL